jgi:hypothetical protein
MTSMATAKGIGRIDPPPIKFTPEQIGDHDLLAKVLVVLTVCYDQLQALGIVVDTDPLAKLREQEFGQTG